VHIATESFLYFTLPATIAGAACGDALEDPRGGKQQLTKASSKKVEMLFAHLKRILKLDRLRFRGPNGTRDEVHLAATALNLRKLAKLIPIPSPSLATLATRPSSTPQRPLTLAIAIIQKPTSSTRARWSATGQSLFNQFCREYLG